MLSLSLLIKLISRALGLPRQTVLVPLFKGFGVAASGLGLYSIYFTRSDDLLPRDQLHLWRETVEDGYSARLFVYLALVPVGFAIFEAGLGRRLERHLGKYGWFALITCYWALTFFLSFALGFLLFLVLPVTSAFIFVILLLWIASGLMYALPYLLASVRYENRHQVPLVLILVVTTLLVTVVAALITSPEIGGEPKTPDALAIGQWSLLVFITFYAAAGVIGTVIASGIGQESSQSTSKERQG